MASPDPGNRVVQNVGLAQVVVGPGVADTGLGNAVSRCSEADRRKIVYARLSEAKGARPVTGIDLGIAVPVPVIGQAGHVEEVCFDGIGIADAVSVSDHKLGTRVRERSSVGRAWLPYRAQIGQQTRPVIVNVGTRKMVLLRKVVVGLDCYLVGRNARRVSL